MKNIIFLLLASFAFSLTFSAPAGATVPSDAPQHVTFYAGTQLPLVKQDFYEDPVAWGFQDAAQIDRATLGPGLQVHYWKDDALLEEQSWEFVIEADGQPRSFLTVSAVDGYLQVTAAGGRAETFKTTLDTFERMAPNAAATLIKNKNNRHLLGTVDGKQVIFPLPERAESWSGTIPLYETKAPAPAAYALADTAVLAVCGGLFALRFSRRRITR